MVTNEELLARRIAMRDEEDGPRVGDYVIFPDGTTNRFSYDWGESVQTSPGGSWYLGDGYTSFSGALDPPVPKESLKDTGESQVGRFWFFDGNYARAGGGVNVEVPCRVYRYSGADKRY